ncbi:alpha/beta hydrolase [Spirillospora sp. CA-294931]|uniref:alpha/beta hydrolase n=1 Tax=Spirillospora sp. CA-294931 TaxID=3240042 RepID=UPI003D929612
MLKVTAVFVVAAALTVVSPSAAEAADEARVVGERWLDSRTVDLTIASPAVGRTMPVRLLVPNGWSKRAARTWPVVYLLHGARDDYTSWTRETDIEAKAASSGALVVMPDAGWAASYTDWWNYGKGGPPAFETFHLKELLGILERDYKAGDKRGVVGVSAGGYGAFAYAARHPKMFRFAGSYSGFVATQLPGVPVLMMAAVSAAGLDAIGMWGPPYGRVWRQHDPLYLANRLRGLGLHLSSGLTGLPGPLDKPDEPWTASEVLAGKTSTVMARKLKRLKIPAKVHLYEKGRHAWPYWQKELDDTWPDLLRSIGAASAASQR